MKAVFISKKSNSLFYIGNDKEVIAKLLAECENGFGA